MKKVLKILGVIVGAFILIVGLLIAWIGLTDTPTYETKELDITVPTDSTSIAKGMRIVEIGCAHCHRSEKGTLEGRQFYPDFMEFGELWSGNITNHPTAGLGRYTNGEIAYLLRTGIKRDGKLAGPFMFYPKVSDEDIGAIIAYLRSEAPSFKASDAVRKSNYSLLAKALMKFGAIGPMPFNGESISSPPESDKIAFGKYLAHTVFDCSACHSASFETYNPMAPESSPGYMAGGSLVPSFEWEVSPSRNITPHLEQGIGGWTYEEFTKAIRAGIRPNGEALSDAMPRFALMDDNEAEAIWSYLQTLEPSGNNPLMAEK